MLTPSIIQTDLTCMSSRTEESVRLGKISSYLNRDVLNCMILIQAVTWLTDISYN